MSVTSKGDTGLSSYNYLGGQLHNEGVLQAEERHFATAGQVDNLDYFEPQEIQVQQIEATQQPGKTNFVNFGLYVEEIRLVLESLHSLTPPRGGEVLALSNYTFCRLVCSSCAV